MNIYSNIGDMPQHGPYASPLVFKINTMFCMDNSNVTFRFPVVGYTGFISWGDGTVTQHIADTDLEYVYDKPGQYVVTVLGSATTFGMVDSRDIYVITEVSSWGTTQVKWWGSGPTDDGSGFLANRRSFILTALDAPLLHDPYSLAGMFRGCHCFNSNIGHWLTCKVIDFSYVFDGCAKYNGYVGNWDVSNGKIFKGMFKNASSYNQEMHLWDMSSAEDISYMLAGCGAYSYPLGRWDVSNVKSAEGFLYSAKRYNHPLNSWKTRSFENISHMFREAISYNQIMSAWDLTYVNQANGFLYDAKMYRKSLANLQLQALEECSGFAYGTKLTSDDLPEDVLRLL